MGNEHEHPRPRACVLLVDDSPELVDVIAVDLSAAGHRVVSATHTANALALAEHVCPHLALLDLSMPRAIGWKLARQLRARFGAAILIVGYVGRTEDGDPALAVAAGCDRVLMKPATLRELRALAEEAIRGTRDAYVAMASLNRGSDARNVVPSASDDSTSMRPPCARTI